MKGKSQWKSENLSDVIIHNIGNFLENFSSRTIQSFFYWDEKVNFFFVCYMATPRLTLVLSQIENLTHPMFILGFCYLGLNQKFIKIVTRRLGPAAWPSIFWGLILIHSPTSWIERVQDTSLWRWPLCQTIKNFRYLKC